MGESAVVVSVVRGRDLRVVQKLGVQDPYVVLRLGTSAPRRSETHDNGGTAPIWHCTETFTDVPLPLPVLQIDIMNNNWIRDKPIGICDIDLNEVFRRASVAEAWFPVKFEGARCGDLHVKLQRPSSSPRPRATSTSSSSTNNTVLGSIANVHSAVAIAELRDENARLRSELAQLRRLLPQQTFLHAPSYMADIPIVSSANDLQQLRPIGTGAHGTVYHGLYKNDVVAVKCLDQVEDLTTFHREVSAMFKLQSQHTVQLLAMADLDTNQPKIVMPYMVHGDLRTHLDKRRANERTGCTLPHQAIAVAVAAALVDLHKCNVIHRDLKPQNVLLSTDNLVQVADFGIARENGLRSKTAEVGTPLYMAPEAFSTSHYGTEVDVYALGVLLTELDTTMRPYSEECVNEYALFMQVSNGRRPLLSLTCPLWYFELAHKCMAADPIDRPTAAQVHKCLSQHANDLHTTTTSGVPIIAGTDVTFVRRLSPSTELALYGSDPVVLQTVAPTLADARAYERHLGNLFTLDAQPHLVRLVGVVGGASSKLVLEFLDGGDLVAYLEQPEPRRRVSKLNLAIGITHGLHALHAQGMVHGHLEAKHVYLTTRGDVKLASFKFGHTGAFSDDIFALGNLFARVDAAYAQPSAHDPVLAFIIQRCCADEPSVRPSTTDLLACLASASVA